MSTRLTEHVSSTFFDNLNCLTDASHLVCATERTLCCVLENYQTPEGFNVPEVLRKYIPGQPEFLPFVKEWKQPKDAIPDRTK
jgi:seryl-tRNA synthetase